jgi:hypothetical protein
VGGGARLGGGGTPAPPRDGIVAQLPLAKPGGGQKTARPAKRG